MVQQYIGKPIRAESELERRLEALGDEMKRLARRLEEPERLAKQQSGVSWYIDKPRRG